MHLDLILYLHPNSCCMQILKPTIFCLGLLLTFSSCKSYSKTTVTSDIQGPTVIQKPVIADLDVQPTRVIGTATGKGASAIDELKQQALSDALMKSNADVLIEPRYEISSKFNRSTVNVTGYPATYKNFRSMEAEDTIFVSKTPLNVSPAPRELKKNNTRRNKILGMSLGGFGGAVVIAGLIAWLF